MITVILCIILLSYMYGEGKSNYFKGSILILSYFSVMVGFFLSGYANDFNRMGVDPSDTLALGAQYQSMKFTTYGGSLGGGRGGRAF